MVVPRNCQGTNTKGERCRAFPIRDSDFCVFHDPEYAEAVQEARRVGGMRRRKEVTVAVAFDFEGLESIPRIRRLLEIAAADLLGMETTLGKVRAMGYVAQVAVTLLEKGEHEERLEAIEAVLGPKLPQRRQQEKRGRWSR
jgi:hypothetical protein